VISSGAATIMQTRNSLIFLKKKEDLLCFSSMLHALLSKLPTGRGVVYSFNRSLADSFLPLLYIELYSLARQGRQKFHIIFPALLKHKISSFLLEQKY